MDQTTPRRSFKQMIEEAGVDLIGQRIRRHRTAQNLSIRDLADKAGVSKNTLVRLEQGFATQTATIKELCRALGLKSSELFGPDFPGSPVIGIHRRSEDVWYDMNTMDTVRTSDPLSEEDLDRVQEMPHVTMFTILRSRDTDGVFNPNIVRMYHPGPERSHRGTEFAFVLKGTLAVVFRDRTEILGSMESIKFYAGEYHYYAPHGEDLPVEFVSIVLDNAPREAWSDILEWEKEQATCSEEPLAEENPLDDEAED